MANPKPLFSKESQPNNTDRLSPKQHRISIDRTRIFKTILINRLKKRTKVVELKTETSKERIFKKSPINYGKTKSSLRVISEPGSALLVQANFNQLCTSLDKEMVVVQAQVSGVNTEEIYRLIKKLALGFAEKKSESCFLINEGIFAGTFFHLSCNRQDLSLEIKNGQKHATDLLLEHQEYLRQRLLNNDINLQSLVVS